MDSGNKILAALLHSRECPFGYQCMATDCEKCVKIHMEKGNPDGLCADKA